MTHQPAAITISTPAGTNVSVQIWDSLQPLTSTWRLLEHHNTFAFQSCEWVTNWHQHAGSDVAPCPVLISDMAGEPQALLPLGIKRTNGVRKLIWLGGTLADYHAGLFTDEALSLLTQQTTKDIWDAIRVHLPAHDCAVLEKQPATIGSHGNPFIFAGSTPHSCNAHATRIKPPLDEFIASKQSKSWRKKERRSERRLADAGAIRFRVANGKQEIETILATLFEQKSRSYKELGTADLFADPQQRAFVTQLSLKTAPQGSSVTCALYIGDRIAATAWCLVHAKRCYFLLPTYANDELSRFSPGNLLLRHLFQWCLDNGIEVFDFTAGDEAYKEPWCDITCHLYDYLAGYTARGYIYISGARFWRLLKLRIKKSAGLFSFARRIRAIAAN